MFSGIISNLGKIADKTKDGLSIRADIGLIKRLSKGDSIAVDGICLTVVFAGEDSFKIDFIPETEEKTNIKYLKTGDLVNLELPVTPATFLSGHIVQGHIDGLGQLEATFEKENSKVLRISIPLGLSQYLVNKGSICVNGIALTVIESGNNFFTVGIIPHTWQNTMLKNLNLGDFVNIEVDILAKYVKKLRIQ